MVEYATTECATCHAIVPMNEMREVKVRRVTGVSYGSGSARGSTSSNSSSFGGGRPARMRSGGSNTNRSHANKRTHMAVDRVWVCAGCKAPKSDMSPTAKSAATVALGAIAFLAYGAFGPASTKTADANNPSNAQSQMEVETPLPQSEQTLVEDQPVTDADKVVADPEEQAADSPPSPAPAEAAQVEESATVAPERSATQERPAYDGVAAARKAREEGDAEAARLDREDREKMERYAKQSR